MKVEPIMPKQPDLLIRLTWDEACEFADVDLPPNVYLSVIELRNAVYRIVHG